MNPKFWKWIKFALKPQHVLSLESPIYAGLATVCCLGVGTVTYICSSDINSVLEDGLYIPLRTEYRSFKSGMSHLKDNILGFKKTTDGK